MDTCVKFCDLGLKSLEASFSDVDNFRLEEDGDIISSVVIEPKSANVRVKFGDSRSNRSPDIRLLHFVTNNDDVSRPRRRMPVIIQGQSVTLRHFS